MNTPVCMKMAVGESDPFRNNQNPPGTASARRFHLQSCSERLAKRLFLTLPHKSSCVKFMPPRLHNFAATHDEYASRTHPEKVAEHIRCHSVSASSFGVLHFFTNSAELPSAERRRPNNDRLAAQYGVHRATSPISRVRMKRMGERRHRICHYTAMCFPHRSGVTDAKAQSVDQFTNLITADPHRLQISPDFRRVFAPALDNLGQIATGQQNKDASVTAIQTGHRGRDKPPQTRSQHRNIDPPAAN